MNQSPGSPAKSEKFRQLLQEWGSVLSEADFLQNPEKLRRSLLRIFRDPEYTPPLLPKIAYRINHLASQPEVNIDNVVALLEQDPMLSGKVLRLSQSSAYAGRGSVTTLRQAIIRLGLSTVRDALWEVILHDSVFRANGYTEILDTLRLHSVASAHATRVICLNTQQPVDYAFLCGLMHDIGIAALFTSLYEMDIHLDEKQQLIVWQVINDIHEEATGIIARLWRLAPEIRMVISNHHHIDKVAGLTHPVSAAVCLAEHLATELGFPPLDQERASKLDAPVDLTDPSVLSKAMMELHLTHASFEHIRDETEEILSEIR